MGKEQGADVAVSAAPLLLMRRRYSTDLSDAQWVLVEPLLPQRRVGDGRGAPRQHDRRDILNAIFYQARTGCTWRDLPGGFPPWQTVYRYFRD